MGPSERKILAQVAKQKGEQRIPEKIKNAPELNHGNEFWWGAFMDLTSERQVGMAEGPVPWSAIHLWENALPFKLSEEDSCDLHLVLGKMDEAYLKFRVSKAT